MTEAEIVGCVGEFPSEHVILTGGEPALQLTAPLLGQLKRAGKIIHIETNGTVRLADDVAAHIDWITVSPKFGMIPEIQRIDELKVVFDMNHTDHIDRLAGVRATDDQCYYLQPCDRNDAVYNERNLAACIDYIRRNPRWKLSLQLHKLLGIR